MNTYYASEIEDSTFFTKDVYLDKKFLLLIPEEPFSDSLRAVVNKWDFSALYCAGEKSKKAVVEEGLSNVTEEKGSDSVNCHKMKELEVAYKDFYSFIAHIFSLYAKKSEINARFVSDRAKELCDLVRENKRLVLRMISKKTKPENDFLAMHSLRSTIYAIIIGLQLKMPPHKLIELTVSCLMHEIGMTRFPLKICLADRPLTEKEKKAIATHPIISYNILREHSFSMPVCLGALEHHERENGSGYPRRLSDSKISLYGKIIAIACSYEAATSTRPYKEATTATEGLLDLIRNEEKAYSEGILKALLYSLSFYPVGSYVHLSNGKIGQVIDVNPSDPRFPIVQTHIEANTDEQSKIIGTSAKGLRILKPLTRSELETLNL